ncbi:hypothetical protein BDA96_04G327000 [Sorghum bicolor]|uniref:Uncharacterized protein n=2 Tax=Sorghum bicolor TaxID=4558 RepID=A0A921UMK1_SORBI|nr:hypothetical protein BDA96_04G327000 [Sorghum bicolor]OQU85779.1 hypothetical protein SORBI_3004G305766 [Sorghum bicolor]
MVASRSGHAENWPPGRCAVRLARFLLDSWCARCRSCPAAPGQSKRRKGIGRCPKSDSNVSAPHPHPHPHGWRRARTTTPPHGSGRFAARRTLAVRASLAVGGARWRASPPYPGERGRDPRTVVLVVHAPAIRKPDLNACADRRWTSVLIAHRRAAPDGPARPPQLAARRHTGHCGDAYTRTYAVARALRICGCGGMPSACAATDHEARVGVVRVGWIGQAPGYHHRGASKQTL